MISIIIIVKNDRGIDKTLAKLITIPKPDKTEIIVVDASDGKLDDIKRKYPTVKWIPFIAKTDKKITIPEQRNVGVKNAKGDVIVFIDAGCIPQENWLKNLLLPIYKENESIVAGMTKSAGTSDFRDQAIKLNEENKYLPEAATINLAIKKEVFDKIRNFDEKFGCGEDIDFSWRAIEVGYKIRYAQDAQITHDWGDWKQELNRSFWYGTARAQLYKKHYNRIKYLFTHDITAVLYPLFIVGLPLTYIFPFYPLLILIPLVRNLNEKPVRILIDHLVYGLGFLKGMII